MRHRKGKWLVMPLILALTLAMVPEASSTPVIEETTTQTPGLQEMESEQETETEKAEQTALPQKETPAASQLSGDTGKYSAKPTRGQVSGEIYF